MQTILSEITLRPTSRSAVVRLTREIIEALPDPATVDTERERVPLKPLPLADVIKNLETLHARCIGVHRCGLPRKLQRFDLHDYLLLARRYAEANAS